MQNKRNNPNGNNQYPQRRLARRQPIVRTAAGAAIFGNDATRDAQAAWFNSDEDALRVKHNRPLHVRLTGSMGGSTEHPSILNIGEMVGVLKLDAAGQPELFELWAAAIATEPGTKVHVTQRFPAPASVLQNPARERLMAYVMHWNPVFGFLFQPRTLEGDGYVIKPAEGEPRIELINANSEHMVPMTFMQARDYLEDRTKKWDRNTDMAAWQGSIWAANFNVNGGGRMQQLGFLRSLEAAGIPPLNVHTGIEPFVKKRMGKALFEELRNEIDAEFARVVDQFPAVPGSGILHGKVRGAVAALMVATRAAGYTVPVDPVTKQFVWKDMRQTDEHLDESLPEATLLDFGYEMPVEEPVQPVAVVEMVDTPMAAVVTPAAVVAPASPIAPPPPPPAQVEVFDVGAPLTWPGTTKRMTLAEAKVALPTVPDLMLWLAGAWHEARTLAMFTAPAPMPPPPPPAVEVAKPVEVTLPKVSPTVNAVNATVPGPSVISMVTGAEEVNAAIAADAAFAAAGLVTELRVTQVEASKLVMAGFVSADVLLGVTAGEIVNATGISAQTAERIVETVTALATP